MDVEALENIDLMEDDGTLPEEMDWDSWTEQTGTQIDYMIDEKIGEAPAPEIDWRSDSFSVFVLTALLMHLMKLKNLIGTMSKLKKIPKTQTLKTKKKKS